MVCELPESTFIFMFRKKNRTSNSNNISTIIEAGHVHSKDLKKSSLTFKGESDEEDITHMGGMIPAQDSHVNFEPSKLKHDFFLEESIEENNINLLIEPILDYPAFSCIEDENLLIDSAAALQRLKSIVALSRQKYELEKTDFLENE